jgi:hypothetical protein
MYNAQEYGVVVSTPNKLWYEDDFSYKERQTYLQDTKDEILRRHEKSREKRREIAKETFSYKFIKGINELFPEIMQLRRVRVAHLRGAKTRMTKEKVNIEVIKRRVMALKETLILKEKEVAIRLLNLYEPYELKGYKIQEISNLRAYYDLPNKKGECI